MRPPPPAKTELEVSVMPEDSGVENEDEVVRNDRIFREAIRDSQANVRRALGIDDPAIIPRMPRIPFPYPRPRFPIPGTEPPPEPTPPPPVPPPTVRVRLSLLGTRCILPTWDHAFQADGPDDEIFMTAVFTWVNPDGSVAFGPKHVKTPVYGLTWIPLPYGDPVQIPGRMPGPRGVYKGIYTGDFAPGWGAPWLLLRHPGNRLQASGDIQLPVLLYEWIGPADQISGTVSLLPSVWEYDNGKPLDTSWGDAEIQAAADIAKKIGDAGGAIGDAIPVLAPLKWVGGIITAVGVWLPKVFRFGKDVIGEAGDRPIGQTRNSDGSRTYDPPVLTIDLSKAAVAAAHTQGFGPGIYVIPVKDSANIGGGEYEMFIGFTYEIA